MGLQGGGFGCLEMFGVLSIVQLLDQAESLHSLTLEACRGKTARSVPSLSEFFIQNCEPYTSHALWR